MYETFDHTADLGLRIRAADLNTLFTEAALALFSVIVEDPSSVRDTQQINVALEGGDLEFLLFDWLKELLYRFDAEQMLFNRFEVAITDSKLQGSAWGERLDRQRHVLDHEVKAITYHGLKVQADADGWLAEVIVDI